MKVRWRRRGGEQKSDRVRRGLELRAHNTEERKRGSAGQLLKRVQHKTREKERERERVALAQAPHSRLSSTTHTGEGLF